jgi:hypothetical protein
MVFSGISVACPLGEHAFARSHWDEPSEKAVGQGTATGQREHFLLFKWSSMRYRCDSRLQAMFIILIEKSWGGKGRKSKHQELPTGPSPPGIN